MKIQKGSYSGAVLMAVSALAVELVDDGINFALVYPLGESEQYSGPRWSKDGVEYGLVSRYRFDFGALGASAQWGDVASWHIYKTDNDTLYAENLHAETYASKTSAAQYANATNRLPVAVIYVPWSSSSLADSRVFLQINPDAALVTGPGIEVEDYSGHAGQWRAALLPEISVSGPSTIAPNDVVDLEVLVCRGGAVDPTCNSEVCVETTGGYLPLHRVRARAGVATFRFHALGLRSGESVKLKIGFRNYSALANKTVHIA